MPWTFQRALYVLIGSWMVVQAVSDGQWSWSIFGAYLAAMGLFSFGCAAGCGVPLRQQQLRTISADQFTEAQVIESVMATPTNH